MAVDPNQVSPYINGFPIQNFIKLYTSTTSYDEIRSIFHEKYSPKGTFNDPIFIVSGKNMIIEFFALKRFFHEYHVERFEVNLE
jgi:hypothetical protein